MREQEKIMNYRREKGELDFTVGFYNRIKQQALISHLLFMQMEKIIKKKMAKGFLTQNL